MRPNSVLLAVMLSSAIALGLTRAQGQNIEDAAPYANLNDLARETIELAGEVDIIAKTIAEMASKANDPKLTRLASLARGTAGRMSALERRCAATARGTKDKAAMNELSAITSLRAIAAAQLAFRKQQGNENKNAGYAPSLAELQKAGLNDESLASGKKDGFTFRIVRSELQSWSADAIPEVLGVTGARAFFVDESGVIRFTTTGTPNHTSTPVGG